jgi:hypothetical protein
VEENEVGGECGTNGAEEERVQVTVEKPEGKRPVGRPRRKWIENVKLDLLETEWGDLDWIGLAQSR